MGNGRKHEGHNDKQWGLQGQNTPEKDISTQSPGQVHAQTSVDTSVSNILATRSAFHAIPVQEVLMIRGNLWPNVKVYQKLVHNLSGTLSAG